MLESLAEEIEEDPVLAALAGLSDVALASADHLHELNDDLIRIRQSRLDGASWRKIISEAGNPHPLKACTVIAADLARACGKFRRALAIGLRHEGLQVTEIASLFDVSRQRVSTLIRSQGTVGSEDLSAEDIHEPIEAGATS